MATVRTWMVVEAGGWLVIFSSTYRKQKERTRNRVWLLTLKLGPSSTLPPARLYFPKVSITFLDNTSN